MCQQLMVSTLLLNTIIFAQDVLVGREDASSVKADSQKTPATIVDAFFPPARNPAAFCMGG